MTTLEQLEEQYKELQRKSDEYKKQEWELKVMKAHILKQMKMTDQLLGTLKQSEIDRKIDKA